ncbi:MAG TPA: DUF2267 domain-containing protein [Actinobacteria bacterium]|nr:DUF2267 domain-containing protein [Actinomycetes bacterium]HEX21123.1 DUF2267 domain-containing protein [Actinomycetota bacterium]
MKTKMEFLNRVRELSEIRSISAAEKSSRAVFMALKEALLSENIEEEITDRLSPELKRMFEYPKISSFKKPGRVSLNDDDVVEEGHEPEEIVIQV